MSKYYIEIEDKALEEAVSFKVERLIQSITEDELSEHHNRFVKNTRDLIHDIVYAHKDEIVERVVQRASVEIVKKALPRFIERMNKDESQS